MYRGNFLVTLHISKNITVLTINLELLYLAFTSFLKFTAALKE